MTQILYPCAKNTGDSSLVYVHDADKGQIYECFGCDERLIPRQGSINAWHFAHEQIGECNGETVLHKLAKDILFRSIEIASTQGSFELSYVCQRFHPQTLVIGAESSMPIVAVSKEERLTADVQSDVAVILDDDRRIAIEVVVSHKPEPRTLRRYYESRIPVFCVYPTWEDVTELSWDAVEATETHLAGSFVLSCTSCLPWSSSQSLSGHPDICPRHGVYYGERRGKRRFHTWGNYQCIQGMLTPGSMATVYGQHGLFTAGINK